MSGRRLIFHLVLITLSLIVGIWSIWLDGIVPEGKNYPNITALAMVLLVIGQVFQIKAGLNQNKKDKNSYDKVLKR